MGWDTSLRAREIDPAALLCGENDRLQDFLRRYAISKRRSTRGSTLDLTDKITDQPRGEINPPGGDWLTAPGCGLLDGHMAEMSIGPRDPQALGSGQIARELAARGATTPKDAYFQAGRAAGG